MKLVIDIGNTQVKAALFSADTITELKCYEKTSDLVADTAFIKKANRAIIGSVVNEMDELYQILNTIIPTHLFTTNTRIPLCNLYESASTLGSDRLAASIGAYYLYPNTPVLTIDAGTCIKYNFTNAKNDYLGGGISPGIHMRFKALHHFTSKLPLIKYDEAYTDLIGKTTQNSILSGVLNGTVAEIDGIITNYLSQYPTLICVLTGGDSQYLAKRLKNSIFTHQNLVLKGLNHILTQLEQK